LNCEFRIDISVPSYSHTTSTALGSKVEEIMATGNNFFQRFNVFFIDWCYDHEFVIASPIDYDHGCVPIGWRDH